MYANTPEAAEARQITTFKAMQAHIGGCREWVPEKHNCCFEPAEYVLWGKLIPPEGLGPRCYDHAAKHVGHNALAPRSGWALVNLVELAREIDNAHFPKGDERRGRRPQRRHAGAVDLIRRLLPGWGSDEHGCDSVNYAAYEEAVALVNRLGGQRGQSL